VQIVLGNSSVAGYPEGGGVWSWFLQYPLAFKAAGHDILWLELLRSSKNRDQDARTIAAFYDRVRQHGLEANSVVLLFDRDLDFQPLDDAEVFGLDQHRLHCSIREADLLLNFACALRQPLLSMFRKKALLDGDPGHLQISALDVNLDIQGHDTFLTVGGRINAADSRIPKLGQEWHTFEQLLYLPRWPSAAPADRSRPFTSITQWTWEQLLYKGKMYSVSKRDAYLRYIRLPGIARCPLELAANIGMSDPAGDRPILLANGWQLVEPALVASSPELYQDYIHCSRGEFMCPKPIHVDLKTGWFSDRSIAYLASGRPVVAEETGFSERIPAGIGLIAFHDIETAAAAIVEIDSNYAKHHRAAREIAEACFDWRQTIETILSACT